MLNDLPNLVGMLGVIIVLATYLLLQLNRLSSLDLSYSIFNCIGSVFILYSLYYHWNFPAALIEIVWIMISLYGIYRVLKKSSK